MKPQIIKGDSFADDRGVLNFNNSFDLSPIKRIYEVINVTTSQKRGWKGHRIEQRWFIAKKGRIKVEVLPIADIEENNIGGKIEYILDSNLMDVLHIPAGYATCIQKLSENASLLAFSDYGLTEINDDYNWPLEN